MSKTEPNEKELYRRAVSPPISVVDNWLRDFRNPPRETLKKFVDFKYGKKYREQYAEKIIDYLERIKYRVPVAPTITGSVTFSRLDDVLVEDLKDYARWLSKTKLSPYSICSIWELTVSFFDDMGHPIPEKSLKKIRRNLLPRAEATTRDKILTKAQFRRVIIETEKLQQRSGKKGSRGYSTEWSRSFFLTLLCTGLRLHDVSALWVEQLHLDDNLINGLSWIDLHRLKVLSAKRRGKRLPPFVFLTPECADAIRHWLSIRDTLRKRGCNQYSYSDERVWNMDPETGRCAWNLALKNAGLGERDQTTLLKTHVYHLHTLRKFFRTNLRKPTKLDPKWIPRDIIEGMIGHVEGLDTAYVRMTKEDLAEIYKNHMENVTIFTNEGEK